MGWAGKAFDWGPGIVYKGVTGGRSITDDAGTVGHRLAKGIGLEGPDAVDTSALDGLTPALKEDRIRALEREGKIDAAMADSYRRAVGLPPSHIDTPTFEPGKEQADTEPGGQNAHHVGQRDVTDPERAATGGLAAPPKVEYDSSYDQIQQRDLGRASMEDATTVDRSKIDADARQLRGSQLSAAQQARDAPSSAAAQFRAALIAAQEAQLGAAAQSRGADRAGARREAVLGIGRDAIQGAEKAAELAAREQQAKTAAYSSTLAGVAGHDVEVGSTNANLSSASNLAQATLTAARHRADVAEANKRALDTAKLGLDMDVQNKDNLFKIKTGNLAASTTNAGNVLDANKTGFLAGVDVSKFNAGQGNVIKTGNAERGVTVDTTNASADNTLDASERVRKATLERERTKSYNDALIEHKRLLLEAQKGKDSADINRQNLIQGAANGIAGAPSLSAANTRDMITVAGLKQGVATGEAARQEASNARLGQFVVDGAAAAATGGASLAVKPPGGASKAASDERVKRQVSTASAKDLAELADKFQAATFRYKGKYDDGDKHAGVESAQELEKTKLGKGLVSKDKDGTRVVDRAGLAMLLAAAAAKSARHGAA